MAKQWWTLDEVREYLGHDRTDSTEVWLSRHGIRPVRHYRVTEVKRERETRQSESAQAQAQGRQGRPTSTTWHADDGVHSVTVDGSGNWVLWRDTEQIDSDDSKPTRPSEYRISAKAHKMIGHSRLRGHGFKPMPES